jgi:hypothetical protein
LPLSFLIAPIPAVFINFLPEEQSRLIPSFPKAFLFFGLPAAAISFLLALLFIRLYKRADTVQTETPAPNADKREYWILIALIVLAQAFRYIDSIIYHQIWITNLGRMAPWISLLYSITNMLFTYLAYISLAFIALRYNHVGIPIYLLLESGQIISFATDLIEKQKVQTFSSILNRIIGMLWLPAIMFFLFSCLFFVLKLLCKNKTILAVVAGLILIGYYSLDYIYSLILIAAGSMPLTFALIFGSLIFLILGIAVYTALFALVWLLESLIFKHPPIYKQKQAVNP